MDALPLRQAKAPAPQSQQLPSSKANQSQTTMDLYLRPIAKVKQGQNDIRKYFPPVARTKASSNSETRMASSPAKMPAMSKPNTQTDGAAKFLTLDLRPSIRSTADSLPYITESRVTEERRPGTFARVVKHNHARSAVLPPLESFFDGEEFPHLTSPRTDIVRHSLVPKPLNIKMPPSAAEASRSPSQSTSSPSSVEDLDTASLDGERREAPSFKQTYLSVHSRHHARDNSVGPLTALRDPSGSSVRQHRDRPATLRSKTAPKRLEPYPTDSVIYFLPEISPTSGSSADELEPLIKTTYPKRKDKALVKDMAKAKSRAVKLESISPVHMARKKEALKERDVTVSPGMRTPSALTSRSTADVHRTPTILQIPCISNGYSPCQDEGK